ncbi:MAG: YceI family protein [Vulcanimicrobiaceae bacterium]
MKRAYVPLVAALVAAACLRGPVASADSSEQRPIDAAKSKAQFSITHVFVEHVTGTVPILSGSLTLAAGTLVPSSATAVLDATQLATGDRDQTDSLRSPVFFDVKRYPTWTYARTSVTPHGSAAFGMDGTLTIHGVTQPEHLDVTVQGDAVHPLYHAIGHIDRHAFGMSVPRLDAAIGGVADVTLDIALK